MNRERIGTRVIYSQTRAPPRDHAVDRAWRLQRQISADSNGDSDQRPSQAHTGRPQPRWVHREQGWLLLPKIGRSLTTARTWLTASIGYSRPPTNTLNRIPDRWPLA